ncbi:hypothetical protein PFICI_02664 [Pestalotiopsis fici W106-1]|uniref:Uncharacterized protein n=1 Tax=Pestalotiopsis fici (strain W106-1 / CGMCC3.15140) TaxID=1229662 RepID=W3XF46_PESFW|nr:uncharacterized protein PFICI_02664 [Pestalotiopsis fici W106-1]ETS84639.1 hypothetical protein PFICI_02664 [Pestalotiopsis fici W106-1]
MGSSEYSVYTGFWTNWTDGKVMGATLTLNRSNANLLIAFLAFFLTIVTTRLWAIISFIIHINLSSPDPRDALHHQRQALLRNNGGPMGASLSLIKLAWMWRKSTGTYRRVLPLLLGALLLALGFAVAAGFSSRVSRGSEVLLLPKSCALYYPPNDMIYRSNYLDWQSIMDTEAASYAQSCYSNVSTNSASSCINHPYVQQRLPVTVDFQAPCPFDSDLCALNTPGMILDSGRLDSHEHFGINAPPGQRFQFRRVLHCAPLRAAGHTDTFEYTTNTSFTRYFFGETDATKYTYEYPSVNNIVDMTMNGDNDTRWRNSDYNLKLNYAFPHNGSLDTPVATWSFRPLPGLYKEDADMMLIFLSPNQVQFQYPTADPWYNNSQTSISYKMDLFEGGESFEAEWWYAAEPASPLACHQQSQWCFGNGAEAKCTPLAPISDLPSYARNITDRSSYNRAGWVDSIFNTQGNSEFPSIAKTLGSKSLTSRFALNLGRQGTLTANQWQHDVGFWYDSMLARLQQAIVRTVMGDIPDEPEFIKPAKTDEARSICANQKVIDLVHVSLSVFGLAFIFVSGLLIIIISYILEPLTRCAGRRLGKNSYARLEWYSTGVFQLQRMAHEALGVGDWDYCGDDIPTTAAGTTLALLDISDENHPFLKADTARNVQNAAKTTEKPSHTVQSTETMVVAADTVDSQRGSQELNSKEVASTGNTDRPTSDNEDPSRILDPPALQMPSSSRLASATDGELHWNGNEALSISDSHMTTDRRSGLSPQSNSPSTIPQISFELSPTRSSAEDFALA